MKTRVLIAVITIALMVEPSSGEAAAKPAELLHACLVNGDFEAAKLDGWSFFSRTKEGSIQRSAEAHEGAGAVRLVHTGEKDWALSNSARIAVKPGQFYGATAFIKGKGSARLAIVGYKDGQLVTWELGSGDSRAAADWKKVQAVAEIPPEVNQVAVRLTGTGSADLIVDDVSSGTVEPVRARPKPPVAGHARARVKEKLDRGLLAVPSKDGKGVYLSWRLLESDKDSVAFNVYRQEGGRSTRLNPRPISATTDFVDSSPAAAGTSYFVRAIVEGHELSPSPAMAPLNQQYMSFKLGAGNTVQKIAIADLDGDGKLDYVFKTPNSNIDPYKEYWKKSPGTYKLMAYSHDGKPLWTYDMGWAIEQGIWYSPFVVYDFDGDGRAEVAVKAGEGDPRDSDGRVTTGKEFVVILDGLTGQEITRIPWPDREDYPDYNYYCRNQLSVAYLDGKTPCLLVERGTYNTIKLAAYELHERKLREVWTWRDNEDGAKFRGQGAHCLRAADVDGDGKDEVIIGSAVIDDNGVGLWSTGMGHPDHVTVGDLDPQRPGLEIAYGVEIRQKKNGVCMVDAKTGKILWGLDQPSKHIHAQGMASDIDPRHPGVEVYGGERDDTTKRYLYTAQGKLLSADKDLGGLAPKAAFWDASPQRELLARGGQFITFDGEKLSPKIEGSFVAVADLLGDWREEVITTMPDGELRIYTTNIPATDRRTCLMQDHIYRMDIASSTQGYYQLPSISRLPGTEK